MIYILRGVYKIKSLDERVSELEKRVNHLENIIRYSDIMKPKSEQAEAEALKEEVTVEAEVKKEPEVSESKIGEAFVGKYIIGVLAAVLIFIGTIYFARLIWDYMTAEVKLSIISLVGIALSVIGFRLVRTKKNVITSIILGTGAGLVFIAILSANLAFHLIGNNASILLLALWAVIFILSSRYTKMFLTTVIAYIGSYLTLLLGLSLMKGDAELWVLLIFATAISAVMLFTTYKEKKVEFIVSIICALLSYSTILVRCFFDGALFSEPVLNGYVPQFIILLFIYLLMNILLKLNDNETRGPIYLSFTPFITLLTIFFASYLTYNSLYLEVLESYLLFFAINLIQLILNYILYKKITEGLTIYYSIVLLLTSIFINYEMFATSTGIIIVALLLIICEKIFKRKGQKILIVLIVLLDSISLLFSNSSDLIISFYGLIQLGVVIYLLWKRIEAKEYCQINVHKTIALIVAMVNCFRIPANIINYMDVSDLSIYTEYAIGHMLAVTVLLGLYQIAYFNNWKSKDFKFLPIANNTSKDETMNIVFYLLSTFLYFVGIFGIALADEIYLHMIFILVTIVVTVLQTKVISTDISGDMPLLGLWFVLKYLILIWTILWSFSELNIATVAYSVVGLLIAIVCIAIGFNFKIKSIRLYGLVLTIIMVAKFILVDLYEENSITKVLALIAGGCLCFLISFIYNKASENINNAK